ncbi:transcriptional regulator [Halorussus lipolyticus]|uniref:transcriptional regulator n=1 Tax=Halorussus lipolyticus TaxID=3034024 RepID=UPI0023E8C185|nr:transcriptional regulator [Halorussus sp. DT80]
MREADETTRERIASHLRETTASPSALATEFDVTASAAIDHVRHVAQSISAGDDEQLLVAPPECSDCGFDDFDDPANRPSRCPECKSESVEEPAFRIG